MTVARGMVRSGSRVIAAGMVAASRPMSANIVSVVVAMIPAPSPRTLVSAIAKCERSNAKMPAMPTTTSGMTLRIVVTTWTRAAVFTPQMLMSVSSHTIAVANSAAPTGLPTIDGMNGLR